MVKQRIKKLQTQISNQKTALKKQKKVLKKLDSPKKVDNQVVLDSELDSLPPLVQSQIEKESVVFHPNEGPQTEFLAAPERDVLYGGAAGGGMTEKGVREYKRKNPGSKLQTAVTEKNPSKKNAARRKSFCARSKGWTGERGKAARRRWKC